jgi:hypothetical protein
MMADILWLLYIADVVDGLTAMLIFTFVVLLLAALWSAVLGSDEYGEDAKNMFRWCGRFALGGAIAAFVAMVLPSERTIYAVAAVKASETAVDTKIGQKALNALENWLGKQANEMEEN